MKIIGYLKILFSPRYWIMNEEYNKALDEHLNKLMDEHDFVDIDKHSAKIGGVIFWVANHPYASFTYYLSTRGRPSRLTLMRAWNKLSYDFIKQLNKGIDK
jgi:hypothetical protein